MWTFSEDDWISKYSENCSSGSGLPDWSVDDSGETDLDVRVRIDDSGETDLDARVRIDDSGETDLLRVELRELMAECGCSVTVSETSSLLPALYRAW